MGKVDPVEVAKTWMRTDFPPWSMPQVSWAEARAVARVVLAAVERVRHGHDRMCDGWQETGDRCTCGHDALVKALNPRDESLGGGDE